MSEIHICESCTNEASDVIAYKPEPCQCLMCKYKELQAKLQRREEIIAEHEYRWKWLNGSILALSKEGYSEWASVVLAVINKCRYEPLEEK